MSFRDLGLINRRSGVAAREISLAVLAGSLSRLASRLPAAGMRDEGE
jgi:hypothetical protein